MAKRCPKCNSSLIKHVEGKPLSDGQKLGFMAGGAAVGSFFGPAGAAVGIKAGHWVAKGVSALTANGDYDECLSCGHKF